MTEDPFDQLRDVLSSKDKVKRRLNNVRAEIFQSFFENETGPEVKKLKDGQLHPQESPIFLAAAERLRSKLSAALTEDVLVHLDRPQIVTLEDLCKSFMHQLIVTDEEYERAFIRFQRSVLGRVKMVSSKPVPIAISEVPLSKLKGSEVLWQNRVATIALIGSGPAHAEPEAGPPESMDRSIVVYARANLFGSSSAAAQLQTEMGPLLRSLMFSFSQTLLEKQTATLRGSLPSLCDSTAPQSITLVTECLSVFFGQQPKGDSIDGRLRNAMLLITEADRQKHFAIAVSLCFSAMEAMLGRGGGDIVATLSRNIATLLEPPSARRTEAIKMVKKLYDIRSKVLHGSNLDHDPSTQHTCRFLAAAVFKAFLDRREFAKSKSEKPENPDGFFSALENAQMNGQSVEGVSASPARRLWEGDV